jgi:hypothetical protein
VDVVNAIGRGYLPSELPPCFSSMSFALASTSLAAPQPTRSWTTPASLNLARPGSLRRRLSVPNPFSQLALAQTCSQGWVEIEAHAARSMISTSRPVIDRSGTRAVTMRTGFGERTSQRAQRMNRARYVLVSDVSEFYGSIYTHSLEWALDGKAAAKARIASGGPSTLGSRLDKGVGGGQEGQTKGIPISPDTSLILAETILCAIDVELQRVYPESVRRCLRFMDDFEYYASTQSEAEDVLMRWQSLLADYELTVNPAKTFITEGPRNVEPRWRTVLSQFSLRDETDRRMANDIQSFFSLAFDLARENPQEPVMGYAVSTAAAKAQGPESWEAVQRLMLAAATADPSCLRYVANALNAADRAGRAIFRRRLEESMNDLAEYHGLREHGSEVTWALWILRRFRLPVGSRAALSVAKMHDNCSLLLLLDMHHASLVEDMPAHAHIVSRADADDAWKSEDWLLGYECARNGWSDGASFRGQPHWHELLERDVFFLRSIGPDSLSVPPAQSAAATPDLDQHSASVSSGQATGSDAVPATPGDSADIDREQQGALGPDGALAKSGGGGDEPLATEAGADVGSEGRVPAQATNHAIADPAIELELDAELRDILTAIEASAEHTPVDQDPGDLSDAQWVLPQSVIRDYS